MDGGVVGEHGRRGDPEERAEAEEKPDRELFGTTDRDIEAEDAADRADERDDAPPTGEIASEVGAEGGDATREGDEAHGLAEDGPGTVAADGDRLLGDLLEAGHD